MRIWRSGGGFDLDIMRDGTFFRDLGPDHFARYDKTRAAMRLVRRIKDLMSVPISARITLRCNIADAGKRHQPLGGGVLQRRPAGFWNWRIGWRRQV